MAGAAATAEEIIAFCRERLAHYKCPDAIEIRATAEDLDREGPEIRAARAGAGCTRVSRRRRRVSAKRTDGR
jgi:acyl-CoA synthetase (AMP-forming)/AMP-acid ligase II